MKRVVVRSTCLRSVGHDPKSKRLEVEFKKSGAVYQYVQVSTQKAKGLIGADSKGKRFNRTVKPHHPYVKISGGTRKRKAKKKR